MNALIAMMVDDSQSMSNSENVWATTEGWNTFITTQQMRMDDCVFYGAFYGMRLKPRQAFVPLGEAEKLVCYYTLDPDTNRVTGRDPSDTRPVTYAPHDGTSMAASINQLFDVVQHKVDSLPVDEKPVSVTYVIQSDGAENTHNSNFQDAKKRVAGAIKAGNRVIWLQAGHDSHGFAPALGIDPKWIVTYQPGLAAVGVFEKASIAILEELVAPGSGKGL